MKETLIAARSEEEYQEMIDCLTDEKEQQVAFEEFAGVMRKFYGKKIGEHVEKKVNKE